MTEPPPPGRMPPGMTMLVVYVALFGAFIVVNVFWPKLLFARSAATGTVAVAYGLLLIVSAAVMAVLYVRRPSR